MEGMEGKGMKEGREGGKKKKGRKTIAHSYVQPGMKLRRCYFNFFWLKIDNRYMREFEYFLDSKLGNVKFYVYKTIQSIEQENIVF